MIWSGQTTRIRRRVSVITKRPADFIHTVEAACSAWLNKRFYSFVTQRFMSLIYIYYGLRSTICLAVSVPYRRCIVSSIVTCGCTGHSCR
jgi:hypothetical protein